MTAAEEKVKKIEEDKDTTNKGATNNVCKNGKMSPPSKLEV